MSPFDTDAGHVADTKPPLLEIDDACVMRGNKLILDHFDLRLLEGQHTAILGPNGSGKSTLVKLLAHQLHPLARTDERPSVRVFGRARWSVAELRSLLGIVSPALQQDFTTDTPLEVFDAVVSGFFAARGVWLNHTVTDAMREQAHEALRLAGAEQLLGRQMADLSTGEARRVLIARALAHRPRALLLDEPCAGLDMASRRRFLENLRLLARRGTTLLLVTHHIEEILPEIERVVMLRHGRILHDDSKAALLTEPALSELFELPVQVQRRGEYYAASL